MLSSLKGRRVKIFGGYDFIREQGVVGTIAQLGARALLLRLDSPLMYVGKKFEHVVVQVRRGQDRFDPLLFNGHVECHCLWVPVERFDPAQPLEVGWWRGGDNVVSTIMLAEHAWGPEGLLYGGGEALIPAGAGR